ncbi:MAG: response regulator, partial [Verrucomicrobia bacterium]
MNRASGVSPVRSVPAGPPKSAAPTAPARTGKTPSPMFSSLRARLAFTVIITVLPAWAFILFTHQPWLGFAAGFLALVAAWFGGERFILQQVHLLYHASRRLEAGDLKARSGLSHSRGELGALARTFDAMAASLEKRALESDEAAHTLLRRALQQTVVAALGQFALVSTDLKALLGQASMLVSQTLEIEFVAVLELQPGGQQLEMRAGYGWRDGCIDSIVFAATGNAQCGFILASGEPVVTRNLTTEKRFTPCDLLREHGACSGVSVTIATRQSPYGVLMAYTSQERVFTEDEAHFLFSVATAIGTAVERNRTEAELRKLAAFAQLSPNAAMEIAADATITYFNDAALQLAMSVQRSHPREVLPANMPEVVRHCLNLRQSSEFQTEFAKRTLAWAVHPVADSSVVHCYVEDITDRLNLEAQLLQSQKMDSVGQLAAGVAHDFNNLLTIIQGHAGLLMARPNIPKEMYDSAQSVFAASERAASLTRQLLMFSRKSVMQTRLLDLRELLANLTKMLKRLIGETISLEFLPPAQLPRIRADAGMIEQIILNLAVNARDAMPRGGTLTMSVSSVELGSHYVSKHPEARPGQFVCLRVSDVGCGMDAATLNRIFEPFFTTKEVGKGTGLGLATVYGIVKQHEGWIEVTSAVGRGTTFNIFLPVSLEAGEAAQNGSDPTAFVRGGRETVLVVEDEPVLRDMAQMILEEYGYKVLTAGSGPDALDLWECSGEKIELLVTDMVMPNGVSGVELAERLLVISPNLKLVFTSG